MAPPLVARPIARAPTSKSSIRSGALSGGSTTERYLSRLMADAYRAWQIDQAKAREERRAMAAEEATRQRLIERAQNWERQDTIRKATQTRLDAAEGRAKAREERAIDRETERKQREAERQVRENDLSRIPGMGGAATEAPTAPAYGGTGFEALTEGG